jgi:V/A-type H+-transporting ATPase subunit F
MSTPEHSYRIAIIGPQDTVAGLAALGVEAFHATSAPEVLTQLRRVTAAGEAGAPTYAIVCIIEELVADIDPDEFQKLTRAPLPAVVLLPGPRGSRGASLARLRKLAEQAIGSPVI